MVNENLGNIERFSGFAGRYNNFRPRPPGALTGLLCTYANISRPDLVVDIGCGSGLSTRVWAGRAANVIGIEPSGDMRALAAEQTEAPGIKYRHGYSSDTGLPDDCADIVTCSQSFHWMNPLFTLKEIARILRPGGVFAAYDHDWPPAAGNWQAEAAFSSFMQNVCVLEKLHAFSVTVRRWDKPGHLKRMQACGFFRFTSEIVLHNVEEGDAGRLVGLALSQGSTAALLKNGLPESEIGLDAFREAVEDTLGEGTTQFYFCYRVRLGVI